MKRFALFVLLAATLGMVMPGVAVAQNVAEMDIFATAPERVMIDAVDLNRGTITIGGQAYVLFNGDTSLLAIPAEAGQRPISPRLLRAGMEVMIVTDGTEPEADHSPSILAIWRPE